MAWVARLGVGRAGSRQRGSRASGTHHGKTVGPLGMGAKPGGEVLLRVRVQPKASRNEVVVEPDGRIRVVLTAPPVEGAANEALRVFLAKLFGLPRGSIRVVRGEKSREKTVALAGIAPERVRQILGVGDT